MAKTAGHCTSLRGLARPRRAPRGRRQSRRSPGKRPFEVVHPEVWWRSSSIESRVAIPSRRYGNTTNRGGLVVRARLDRRNYPTGKKVSAADMRALNIERHDFRGEWNYLVRP